MTCETCGAAVEPKDVDEPNDSGHFQEKWECARGHIGYVSGKEQEPPNQWTRTGGVFNDA